MTTTKSRNRKPKPVPFAVVSEVKAEDVASALVSAFEGGSTYWIRAISPPYGPKTVDLILADQLETTVTNDDDELKTLNRSRIHVGLRLMAKDKPGHFADLRGNADATTGDVLLQLCLFGKVVYG